MRVAAIVGPTAAGKTEVSVQVAEALNAEIVSADSMQLYRGMDIGTAKPSPEMLDRVPHHMIDVFDPSHEVTVSEFQTMARAAVADIDRRGRLPLVVGGSGLYYRAVVDDLEFPPRAPEVRRLLEEEAERVGPEVLHDRLGEVDPKAAARIDRANSRRIVRALEVIEITGRPFSDNDTWDRYESIYALTVAGVTRPRAALIERIARRVAGMIEGGLIDEAIAVGAEGMSRTARQALGYAQVLDDPGAAPDDLRDEIVKATTRFARRQESWFRADPRVEWIDASKQDPAKSAIDLFDRSLRLTS